MRPFIIVVAGLGLLGCTPKVEPGQFRCNPAGMNPCPAGWLCLPYANEFRCFNHVGVCGNFLLEAGEECDGTDFAGRACADHYGDSGTMEPRCDDRCRVVCPRCGNAVVDRNIAQMYGWTEDASDFEEQCDHAAVNSDSEPDACRTDCTLPFCGDGVVDTGENIVQCPEDCGVLDVAAFGFKCAIKGNRSLWCWGTGSAGLGDDLGTTYSWTPVRVAGLAAVLDVDVGADHACAIRADRTVWCWGANRQGQIGDGTTEPRPTPVPVPDIEDASDIDCGGYFTCAVRQDQSVWCWGSNEYASLGDGLLQHPECDPEERCDGKDRSTVPVEVTLPVRAYRVVAGHHHVCALLVDGTAWCWGMDSRGQLGDGVTEHEDCDDYDCTSIPVQIHGLTDVHHLGLGTQHTCAVVGPEPRTVWCWGTNSFGQSGAPTVEFLETNEPHQVAGLVNPTLVAAGENHTCAVEEEGTLWCWGSNHVGEFGIGSTGPSSATPVRSDVTGVVKISAAWQVNYVVKEDSTAWTWGAYNDDPAIITSFVSELIGECAVD